MQSYLDAGWIYVEDYSVTGEFTRYHWDEYAATMEWAGNGDPIYPDLENVKVSLTYEIVNKVRELAAIEVERSRVRISETHFENRIQILGLIVLHRQYPTLSSRYILSMIGTPHQARKNISDRVKRILVGQRGDSHGLGWFQVAMLNNIAIGMGWPEFTSADIVMEALPAVKRNRNPRKRIPIMSGSRNEIQSLHQIDNPATLSMHGSTSSPGTEGKIDRATYYPLTYGGTRRRAAMRSDDVVGEEYMGTPPRHLSALAQREEGQ